MYVESEDGFDNNSIYVDMFARSDSNSHVHLDRIDSNLFGGNSKNICLDKFFDNRQALFLEKEQNKFIQTFRSQFTHYQSKFHEIDPVELEKSVKTPNFKKRCGNLVLKNFEKFFDSMFIIKAGTSLEEFVNNLYHKHFEFCFSQISCLSDSLFEFLTLKTPSEMEKSLTNLKKIPWSKEEEKELLMILYENYPMSIPSEILDRFCIKYGRTRSSVSNKIHKLQHKFENEFRQRNVNIFSELVENPTDIDMEQSIFNVIQSETQATYDLILNRLKIQSSQIEEKNEVNQILYDLLNKNKIRCDEKLFIELVDSVPNCLNQNPSPIIRKVIEIISKTRSNSIILEDLRDILVHEFQIVDKKGKDLDEHLMDFLQKSKLIIMKKKRIFY